ncbi:MAG: hypothetical protein KatS3mg031_1374 [Chitinophagales bacterium]|nr:MAG: hypothetical protein KatS3mg031_1374 [Chitinophagales bacterium]
MNNSDASKKKFYLSHLPKKNIYQVPEGFFSQLETDIFKKLNRRPDRHKTLFRWMEYSAAAALLGFLLVSGLRMLTSKNYLPVETQRTIYNIADGDMDGEQILMLPDE